MTQTVNREELLQTLQSVSVGLAAREFIEQSSCFVFEDNRVYTFDGEVAASRDCQLQVTGAVVADKLVELLSRLTEDQIKIEETASEVKITGKRRRGGLVKEQNILLPVKDVEPPEDWSELPDDFDEALSRVHGCATKEESEFVLTCVHITPKYIQACDRKQIARYNLSLPIEKDLLVRATSIARVIGFDMTEFSLSDTWIHFRNELGLVISCRRHKDNYVDIDEWVDTAGTQELVLPGALNEVVSRAQLFSMDNANANYVTVRLAKDRVVVSGKGPAGWFEEIKEVKFGGDPISFMMPPNLLVELSEKSQTCYVAPGRLVVDSGSFMYATSTYLESEVK